MTPGTQIGPYEVLALLGAGGMGEVYRAKDSTLKRDVALKVLRADVAKDRERLARFQREAEVLASLNHPHIAQIYGLERAGDTFALVMELVEGEDLAQRIARGPISLDEALPIARQIAEALEAAHEHGIIHRDLKPANLKVRPDGMVKVLDFGLAKALEPIDASSTNAVNSPTLSMHATAAGVILGTAAYMAPEQARGKVVDRRADIWAWGCVLFEMLTGTRAFGGDDLTDTMVAVLSKEPEWSALPAATVGATPLLVRCLKKDPKQRLQAIGDARIQVDELMIGTSDLLPVPSGRPAWRKGRLLTVVAVAAAAALLSALLTLAVVRTSPTVASTNRFAISLPASQSLARSLNDRDIAISSDGRQLAYTSGANSQIMIRSFDQLNSRPLSGVTNARAPFFSPDGQWVAFFTRIDEGLTTGPVRPDTLRKVSLTGGSPIVICQTNGSSRGASWAPDDTIIFATNDPATGLLRIAAGGSEAEVLTRPDLKRGERDHFFPSLLPGGVGVLFTVYPVASGGTWDIAVLDTKTGAQRTLIRDGQQAEYVETGHLIYIAGGTLWAVPFDVATLATSGDPVPVLPQVMSTRSAANFNVSREGSLIYAPQTSSGALDKLLVWVSREGREEPIAPARRYSYPRLSPDNSHVAVRIDDDQDRNIWLLHLMRQTLIRLTPEGPTYNAVWTPDGSVIFNRGRDLFRKPADGLGTEERLTTEDGSVTKVPTSVSPDSQRVVYHQYLVADSAPDLMVLNLDRTLKTAPLLQTDEDERNGEISPDGRWLAYDSTVSGRVEVYVRPFPNVRAAHFQVSTGGGRTPAWAPSGGELFFISGTRLMAAAVATNPQFVAGSPKVLFDNRTFLLDARTFATGAHRTFDVSRDAQRFLVLKDGAPASADEMGLASIIVVQNWHDELKRLAPKR